MKSPLKPSPVSKGPYHIARSFGKYFVKGPGVTWFFLNVSDRHDAVLCLNTAYLAGKRSQSKGRVKK